jgi:hypothetical protein
LSGLAVRFGNGRSIVVPSNLLECFPDTKPELLTFLFLAVDSKYPAQQDEWWSSVTIPFGRSAEAKPENDSTSDPTVFVHVYPYFEVEIMNWKISNIYIRKGGRESRLLSPASGKCPTADIEWAISKKNGL